MDDDTRHDDLCDEPLKVSADGNAVVLLGPRNIHLTMTADAAAESIRRLLAAVARARLGR
jgi:hypothetical protein